MPRKIKDKNIDLYYMQNGQDVEEKIEKRNKARKRIEREKRIKNKKQENNFDLENEAVIQMTNKNNLKQEEFKRKQEVRNQRKKQKKIRKVKFLLKLIIFLGAIVGSTIFAMTSPIFNIKEINVTNNTIVSNEEIISLSELKLDQNIFKFSKNSVSNKIKQNAYIEDVKIYRKIPGTLQIDVTEREPKYSVDYMGKYAYINTQGYILEISDDSKGLIIIQGITTQEDQVQPGNRLDNDDLLDLENIMKIMNVMKENNLGDKVTSIDISKKNDYSLYMQEEKKRIHLGDTSNLGNKMLYAIAIMEQEKANEGDIYVNGDLNNKFQPFFRQKV